MANFIVVNAGKFEHNGDKNYKYCSDAYATWQEAVNDIKNNGLEGYPFCEVEFHTDGFVRVFDFYEFQRPQDYRS